MQSVHRPESAGSHPRCGPPIDAPPSDPGCVPTAPARAWRHQRCRHERSTDHPLRWQAACCHQWRACAERRTGAGCPAPVRYVRRLWSKPQPQARSRVARKPPAIVLALTTDLAAGECHGFEDRFAAESRFQIWALAAGVCWRCIRIKGIDLVRCRHRVVRSGGFVTASRSGWPGWRSPPCWRCPG